MKESVWSWGSANEQPNLTNLNRALIHNADGPDVDIAALPHRMAPTTSGNVTVFFKNHVEALCEEIRRYDAVVGCMAWLTNEDILTALRDRIVNIIVQKEDWLRPDAGSWSQKRLKSLYAQLTGTGFKPELGVEYCTSGPCEVEAVMCCGVVAPRDKIPPRMHHKFLVFGDIPPAPGGSIDNNYGFQPKAVWTGSFNATHSATLSLENAVLIRCPEIAAVYHAEWHAMLGLAEPLDWNAKYVAPSMRYGT